MGTPAPIPSQWQQLWKLWDAATLKMVPPERHSDRPLELRQPFIFYLGHLPAFTDARLARVLQQQLTEPVQYADMFARGIDPDLDDPTQCHSHSPTPAAWPPLNHILAYRDRVRARILQLYDSSYKRTAAAAAPAAAAAAAAACSAEGSQGDGATKRDSAAAAAVAAMPAELQHVLWMCYEHEAMHLETLMYLLVQYEAVQPPPADLVPAVPAAAWRSDLAAAAAGRSAGSGRRFDLSDSSIAGRHGCSSNGSTADRVQARAGVSSAGCPAGLLPQLPAAAWVGVPACQVTLGFDPLSSTNSSTRSSSSSSSKVYSSHDAEQDSQQSSSSGGSGRGSQPLRFGWDNECPAREVSVSGFKLQHRPVTVLEYLRFMACRLAKGAGVGAVAAAAAGARSSTGSTAVAAAPAGAEDISDATCSTNTCLETCQQRQERDSSASARSCSSKCSDGHGQKKRWTSADGSSSSSSSSTLPEVLAGLQGKQLPSCPGCRQVLQHLLQEKTAAGLLPASLELLEGSATGSTDAGSNCSMLCQLVASSGSSSSSILSTEAVFFDSLQLHVGVKTVFGVVPISIASYWPVYCSALQAEQYAGWLSSKDSSSGSSSSSSRSYSLPTEPELLAARQHTDSLQQGSCASQQLQGAHFAAWHPLCVQLQPDEAPVNPQTHSSHRHGSSSSGGSASCCQAVSQLSDNGWEWTSSSFERHEGFEAHPLYPEYSQDFFGGKHVVLLGGSWATIDSIAGRPTFRNWYQKGQQHVFAKFRLVCAE